MHSFEIKQILIDKETEIDEYFKNLPLWEHSYFTVYLSLCYQAGKLEFENEGDNSGDFFSRLSAFHPQLKELAQSNEFGNTVDALVPSFKDTSYNESLNFLYTYGHFSLLMPQIHRDIFLLEATDKNNVLLKFKSSIYAESEKNDRFLSEISLPLCFSYNDKDNLDKYLSLKVEIGGDEFDPDGIRWVKDMYNSFLRYNVRVEVLSDTVLQEHLGFTNSDFNKFAASMRACAEFLISFALAYKKSINGAEDMNRKEELQRNYIELTCCSFSYLYIKLLNEVSGLTKEVFMKILPYFVTIYSQPNEGNYEAISHEGEAYLAPLTLTREKVLFSPLITRSFLSFDNILYSINKKNRRLFDNYLSQDLEPTLINQVDRLFSNFDGLLRRKNVNISRGEIDYLVLSENENLCLVFQAKATLSPLSNRTIDRVETRSQEGINQLKHFQSFSEISKLKVVNEAFGVDLKNITFVDILLVRSCAGSENVWNSSELIINYQLLCGFLGSKIKNGETNFLNFKSEISNYFSKKLEISSPITSNQKFIINDLTIIFPYMEYSDIMKSRIELLRDSSVLNDYQSAT